MTETAPAYDPTRGREPRAEETARHRRRRKGGTLDRMVQYKLDCIPRECLNTDQFVYRWVKDEDGRLRQATKMDDYEFVSTQELGEMFEAEATDSESTERVRMFGERDKNGNPVFHYLLKKLKEYHDEDYAEVVQAREEQMAGRVFNGVDREDGIATADTGEMPEHVYVPKEATIAHAATRRRGAIRKPA
jgi:hypothetical protein